ncbi:MAG: integration host factor subunit alpha [Burkholderiales bacterium]|nr:integration host factor subunit alpha [Burkholderiales bacterium]
MTIKEEAALLPDLNLFLEKGETLTKAHLCEILTNEHGFTKRQSRNIIEIFFEEVRKSLERGESVKLSGFGSFQLRDKPQRPGRNPKTGEEIAITARRVVTFHTSPKLRELVELESPKWHQGDAL